MTHLRNILLILAFGATIWLLAFIIKAVWLGVVMD